MKLWEKFGIFSAYYYFSAHYFFSLSFFLLSENSKYFRLDGESRFSYQVSSFFFSTSLTFVRIGRWKGKEVLLTIFFLRQTDQRREKRKWKRWFSIPFRRRLFEIRQKVVIFFRTDSYFFQKKRRFLFWIWFEWVFFLFHVKIKKRKRERLKEILYTCMWDGVLLFFINIILTNVNWHFPKSVHCRKIQIFCILLKAVSV